MQHIAHIHTVVLASALGMLAACSRESSGIDTLVSKVGDVRVVVSNIKSDIGTVRIGLYKDEETYSQGLNSFRFIVLPIHHNACEWLITNVPYGEYAISLYHDKNNNEILDRNIAGMPSESYGFSNNAKPAIGMPSYNTAKFVLADDGLTQNIAMQ